MKACPFCLENGELYGEIIARASHTYMVTTEDPVLKHSLMIIPYRHAPTPFDLDEDEWRETKGLLHKAKQWLEPHKPQGYMLGWNVGETGGQHVFHAHLHVIARFADEPLAGKGLRHAFKQPANRRSL